MIVLSNGLLLRSEIVIEHGSKSNDSIYCAKSGYYHSAIVCMK